MKLSPIVIVEDDNDDCELLMNVFQEIGVQNQFRCFDNPVSALEYLKQTPELPFIIISDISMPKMDGLAFKRVINEDNNLRRKRIPFVFLSTATSEPLLDEAFNLSVQGYFKKPNDINSLKGIALAIVEYWRHNIVLPPIKN
ncbi:MAG: response regulator [Ferruginibacter sp.]|nr:response regulator [Ferruginibacter sp.]